MPLSETITPGFLRRSMRAVISRAPRRPEIEVSTTAARLSLVTSSGTFRMRKRPSGECASQQPRPHNPKKQQKNPVGAGSGERFREGKWRAEADETENYTYAIALQNSGTKE